MLQGVRHQTFSWCKCVWMTVLNRAPLLQVSTRLMYIIWQVIFHPVILLNIVLIQWHFTLHRDKPLFLLVCILYGMQLHWCISSGINWRCSSPWLPSDAQGLPNCIHNTSLISLGFSIHMLCHCLTPLTCIIGKSELHDIILCTFLTQHIRMAVLSGSTPWLGIVQKHRFNPFLPNQLLSRQHAATQVSSRRFQIQVRPFLLSKMPFSILTNSIL